MGPEVYWEDLTMSIITHMSIISGWGGELLSECSWVITDLEQVWVAKQQQWYEIWTQISKKCQMKGNRKQMTNIQVTEEKRSDKQGKPKTETYKSY